jgi:hypothetical protein
MKIELTQTARWQLRLLTGIDSKTTGFVLGWGLGRFKIIDKLFPLGFNKKNIKQIYHQLFLETGEQLLGVFFVNSEIFFDDWFLENFIIKITGQGSQVFFYHFDLKAGHKRCQSVLEL